MEERRENDHSCLIIEGRLSIFLSELDLLDSYQSQITKSIKSMMDQGSLNDCHPAIVNITFMNIGLSDTELVAVDPDSDAGDGIEPIVIDIPGNRRSWIATGTVISAFVLLIVVTRYRYSISVTTDEDLANNEIGRNECDSSSSGAFVDVSNYEMDHIRDEEEDDD